MRLVLFSTSGCHLCEQAEEIIRECLPCDFDQVVEIVDIAEQEHCLVLYGTRIPVLCDTETKMELGWPFEQVDVREFLERSLSDGITLHNAFPDRRFKL